MTDINITCVFPPERYRLLSDHLEALWLPLQELVQRFDRHFSSVGVKDFKKSFSGPLPLQEYFLSVDRHFQVAKRLNGLAEGAAIEILSNNACVCV